MRILLLTNQSSGRGRAASVVTSFQSALTTAGHQTHSLTVDRSAPDAFAAQLRAALAECSLLIIAGGDGTVHHVLPHAIAAGTSIYHVPLGTENLFAREFAMRRDAGQLLRAIAAGRVASIDAADLREGENQRMFAIVCGVGPDASVVRRVSEARNGAISHATYLMPVARELLHPWLPRLTIEVDGREIVQGRQGFVVVANSREYGARINPAWDASVHDGLLDVAFFPAALGLHAATWIIRAWSRTRRWGATFARGQALRIRTEGPARAYQVDGEWGRAPVDQPLDLTVAIRPRGLKVLLPAEWFPRGGGGGVGGGGGGGHAQILSDLTEAPRIWA